MPTPIAPRPCPLWVIVVLFALAVVAVPLSAYLRNRPPPPPRNLTELAERLHTAYPYWHIIQVTDTPDGLEAGFWVCERQRSVAELMHLRRTREDGPHWRAVVLCRHEKNPCVNDLGKYGAIVEDFNLFGDPRMVRQIVPLLGE